MCVIALCDDDIETVTYLRDLISEYYPHQFAIDIYSNGQSLYYEIIEECKIYDVILLDIKMPTLDGITLSKKLRDFGYNMPIILVSQFSEYVYEGYDIRAFHFLNKPVNHSKLFSTLENAIKEATNLKAKESLLIQGRGYEAVIPLYDIIYLEGNGRKSIAYTAKEYFEFYEKISDIEIKYGSKGFCRIHRSYVINLRHFSYRDKETIHLKTGVCLKIAKQRIPGLIAALQNYFIGERP